MIGGNKKYSVLVVEDETENLKFLTTLLSRYFNVLTCKSESEFFSSAISNRFDLILMDISLSGEKSGLKIIKSLREIPIFKTIPIICLSAHIAESDKIEALEAGANYYLRKPVQNKILIDTILNLLGQDNKSSIQ
ncbi:CheY-like receiver [Ignavibacterium album JCM 16511]|uniref:CheY-like receiver n=1 Tax=Ignavibacterium album (strain DSM 19864 / JCM 16511 / NBRC 101810 / Mat9-16) TaxID=945713 RepID=I0ANS7_IGNAJ|nr:response regulator [Ignavibacterium album]AFH50634.1 CheY-like receiver [Ignavibacterium album JCM 16511]